MQGETLPEAVLTENGVVGDRAYALTDVESGKVVSAKSVRTFPAMFDCRAAFVEPPSDTAARPPVVITLPDGTSVRSDAADCDEVLSRFFGRKVVLSARAPTDFTIDQYHPDIEDADPAGHRDTVVEAKLGAAFFAELGVPSPVQAGAFFDLFPVSILTSSTLRTFGDLAPDSNFDERRFRMNIVVDTEAPGFVENDWVGKTVSIAGGVALGVAMPDPRCVMTTLAQGDDLPRDADILRTIVKNNRLELADGGRYPCVGAYAVAASGGTVRVGDAVTVD
jgi:uncharacterized protein YcbX